MLGITWPCGLRETERGDLQAQADIDEVTATRDGFYGRGGQDLGDSQLLKVE